MTLLGALVEKEPPPRPGETPPPLTDLDRKILAVVNEGTLCRTGEISEAVQELPRRVSARLRLMADRHFLAKVPVPNGPKRGPGAYTYHRIDGGHGTVVPEFWSSTRGF